MLKQIFSFLVVLTALLLVSGFPAFINLLITGKNVTDKPTKQVMMTGIAFFLYIIGFLGTYFMTFIGKTNYKHRILITCVGIMLFSFVTLAMMMLWNTSNR
jgi:hypothetical protein